MYICIYVYILNIYIYIYNSWTINSLSLLLRHKTQAIIGTKLYTYAIYSPAMKHPDKI